MEKQGTIISDFGRRDFFKRLRNYKKYLPSNGERKSYLKNLSELEKIFESWPTVLYKDVCNFYFRLLRVADDCETAVERRDKELQFIFDFLSSLGIIIKRR